MTRAAARRGGRARARTRVEPVLERRERADALVLGPGLGRADGRAEFARGLAAPGRAAARCSTPTASTPTPGALEALAAAPGADGPHAARRRAGPAARRRLRRHRGARAPAPRARGRAARRRDRRAQGRRHARRRAGRARRRQRRRRARRWRPPAPATCSPASIGRAAGQGPGALHGRLRRRVAARHAGRRAGAPQGRDGVIASTSRRLGGALAHGSAAERSAPPVATVADIMDADLVTVAPERRVETVIAVLREHELPGVPVVDADGALRRASSPRPTSSCATRRRTCSLPASHRHHRRRDLPRVDEARSRRA